MSESDAKRIFSLVDLTSLNETDNAATIAALCQKARALKTAAVCVYPEFIADAIKALEGTAIKVASVVNFPHAIDSLEMIQATIMQSLKNGATEIDVVFPYKDYLSGHKSYALSIIEGCKKIIDKNRILKVILETGILDNLSTIEEVSLEVIAAGADFLKTSTGKVSIGATLEAASAMLYAIKKSGANVGFKASGGIRSLEQAAMYMRLAEDIMGPAWVVPAHFRVGASGLI